MLNVLRSELTRLRRPRILLTWFALMSAFAVMINMVMFSTVTSGSAPAGGGPGVTFPDSAELATSHGLVVGLSSAASMFGVVVLSFWAISTATDYSTGLIRLLASAQPSRWRLLMGKVIALVMVTAAASAVATVVNVMVAPVAAQSAGVRPETWVNNPVPTVLSAYVHLFAAMCVWGAFGLALAVALRSSAVAISIGIGYVLVFESIVRMASSAPPTWLLGTTLSALANGGTAQVSMTSAVAAGLTYALAGLALAMVIFTRRDIQD